MDIEKIARICHEANRALCLAHGDASHAPWDAVEEWQQESVLAGVAWRIQNQNAPPSAQHDAWAADKRLAGWVYGEVKDPAAKTHPCLVPYSELPEEQRAKDVLFAAIV